MAKKYTLAEGHSIVGVNGNLISGGTEVDAAEIGNAETIARYEKAGMFGAVTVQDAKDGVIVTGESTDDAREAVQEDAASAVKDAVKVERTEPAKSKK
jgi:hypothetical protein